MNSSTCNQFTKSIPLGERGGGGHVALDGISPLSYPLCETMHKERKYYLDMYI